MADLSIPQIKALALDAGWNPAQAVIATAISRAEDSSGNPTEEGDVSLEDATWGPSVGPWQIRSLKSQYGTGGLRDEVANKDPRTNARHAFQIFKSDGWSPWSTYNSGAYLKYLPLASAAVPADLSSIGTSLGNTVSGVVDQITGQDLVGSLQGIAKSFGQLATDADEFGKLAQLGTKLFLPTTMVRLACAAFGILFLIFGLWHLGKEVKNG